jgi:hypothetical protein
MSTKLRLAKLEQKVGKLFADPDWRLYELRCWCLMLHSTHPDLFFSADYLARFLRPGEETWFEQIRDAFLLECGTSIERVRADYEAQLAKNPSHRSATEARDGLIERGGVCG